MHAGWLGRIICLILPCVLCACSAAPADLPTIARTAQVTRQPTTILAAEILPTTGSDLPIPTDLGPAERWIEVSLQEQMVRLHVSDRAVAEYPAATGVNTQPETTTYPGLFEVGRKYKGPIEGTPVTAGCVRVAESTAVYDFATLGTKVWIH